MLITKNMALSRFILIFMKRFFFLSLSAFSASAAHFLDRMLLDTDTVRGGAWSSQGHDANNTVWPCADEMFNIMMIQYNRCNYPHTSVLSLFIEICCI